MARVEFQLLFAADIKHYNTENRLLYQQKWA